MILKNKKGQSEIADVVAIILIFLILIGYLFFIVFGSIGPGNEIKSTTTTKSEIEAYNYHMDLVNYLNTEIEYNGENVSFGLLIEDYTSSELNDKNLHDFLKKESKPIFEKLEYCFYDVESKKYLKRKFEVLIMQSSEYVIKQKYGKKGEIYPGEYIFASEFGLGIEQKINQEHSVYLYYRDMKGEDC